MKFTVLSAVKFNGRIYPEGETIDTDEKGSEALPAHCVELVRAKSKKDAKAEDAPATE